MKRNVCAFEFDLASRSGTLLSLSFLPATREHIFKDKNLLYQFWQDEEGAAKLPSPKELNEAVECLPECLAILAKRAPDAALRMMLQKP